MPFLTIVNLTNSPFDIEGGVYLPAMGTVTGEFSEEYAALLHASPGVRVHAADLLAIKSRPLVDRKKRVEDMLNAMSDDELRAFVKERTGKAPSPRAKRETLIARALEG